jgi:hypothetical protein
MKFDNREQRNKAFEIFERLANSEPSKDEKENFWRRLAKEAIANQKSEQSIGKDAKEGVK